MAVHLHVRNSQLSYKDHRQSCKDADTPMFS